MTIRTPSQDLHDDLLADLRSVVPPAIPPRAPVAPRAEDGAAGGRSGPEAAAPSVDIRISRQAWSSPRLQPSPAGSGLVLSAGPLRVHLGLSRG